MSMRSIFIELYIELVITIHYSLCIYSSMLKAAYKTAQVISE